MLVITIDQTIKTTIKEITTIQKDLITEITNKVVNYCEEKKKRMIYKFSSQTVDKVVC